MYKKWLRVICNLSFFFMLSFKVVSVKSSLAPLYLLCLLFEDNSDCLLFPQLSLKLTCEWVKTNHKCYKYCFTMKLISTLVYYFFL